MAKDILVFHFDSGTSSEYRQMALVNYLFPFHLDPGISTESRQIAFANDVQVSSTLILALMETLFSNTLNFAHPRKSILHATTN